MKWRFVLFTALVMAVGAFGCGKDDKGPTTPSDPNVPIYGTYNGYLNMVFFNGTPTLDEMVLTLAKDNVTITLSDKQYATTLKNMSATSVAFSFNMSDFIIECTGARDSQQITGTATCLSIANGTWAVTRDQSTRLHQETGQTQRLYDVLTR